MTHIAWVPPEWEEAARRHARGARRTPSLARNPALPRARSRRRHRRDGARARVPAPRAASPHRGRGRLAPPARVDAAALPRASSSPLLVSGPARVPALAGASSVRSAAKREQLIDVCDRLIGDSREWPDTPEAYSELPFDRTAISDIAWRRTAPWRRQLAALWPGIREIGTLGVRGPLAEATLLAGWLRSRLEHDVELAHEEADELEEVAVDGRPCPLPGSVRAPATCSRPSSTSSGATACTRPPRNTPPLDRYVLPF